MCICRDEYDCVCPNGLSVKTYFEDLVQGHLNERAGGILKLFPVSYDSRDADGKTVKLSGGIFVPQILWGKKLPFMIMLHGTETNKGNVPYYNKGEDTPIAWVAAAIGFIILMPNFPGMGLDSAPYHPYCHGKSLAYSAVDMLTFWEGKLPDGFEWDGRLVVMGYSEGDMLVSILTRPGGRALLSPIFATVYNKLSPVFAKRWQKGLSRACRSLFSQKTCSKSA